MGYWVQSVSISDFKGCVVKSISNYWDPIGHWNQYKLYKCLYWTGQPHDAMVLFLSPSFTFLLLRCFTLCNCNSWENFFILKCMWQVESKPHRSDLNWRHARLLIRRLHVVKFTNLVLSHLINYFVIINQHIMKN